jgi:hypothetical protein
MEDEQRLIENPNQNTPPLLTNVQHRLFHLKLHAVDNQILLHLTRVVCFAPLCGGREEFAIECLVFSVVVVWPATKPFSKAQINTCRLSPSTSLRFLLMSASSWFLMFA